MDMCCFHRVTCSLAAGLLDGCFVTVHVHSYIGIHYLYRIVYT